MELDYPTFNSAVELASLSCGGLLFTMISKLIKKGEISYLISFLEYRVSSELPQKIPEAFHQPSFSRELLLNYLFQKAFNAMKAVLPLQILYSFLLNFLNNIF